MKLRSITCAVVCCVLSVIYSTKAQAETCAESYCSEYLIKFTRSTTEEQITKLLEDHALWIVDYFEASRIYHVDDNHTRSQEDVLEELNAESSVMYAEPNYKIEANTTPNDPLYENLWALNNSGQYDGISGIDLGMESVWDQLIDPEPIIVAVIDSGIDYTHEDLAANIWVNGAEVPDNGRDDDGNGYIDDVHGYNFYDDTGSPSDDYYHGTHVAGTIGAVGNNGIGIAGIDWNVKLMALKFMSATGVGPLSGAIKAIDYAVKNGAQIINNSWNFYYAGVNGLPTSAAQEPVQSLRDAIVAADNAGVIVVAAAGNDGLNDDQYPMYPASYSLANIISVTATDNDDTVPDFSNYGAISVDMGAPGVLIQSTYPTWKEDPPYHFLSGTSMACPHVTGAAALLWAENPDLTHRQVIDYILQGVQPIAELNGKSVTGGRLDLAESFALNSTNVNHPPVANAGSAQYKSIGDTVLLQGTATDADGDSPITFHWTLISPNQETNDFSSAQISFPADLVGTYVATLIASDAESSSVPATVQIYVSAPVTTNHTPVAYAGVAQLRHVGDTVLLQGSGVDDDGDSLTYKWTLVLPSNSHAVLTSTTTPATSFTADVTGTYTTSLSVNDGKTSSAAATAKIYVTTPTTVNHAPVASAGPNQLRRVGDTVLLQGSGVDADGDALTYLWSLTLPSSSHASLINSTSATASFKADVTGTYPVSLIVSDGKTSSVAATAKVYIIAALTGTSTSEPNLNVTTSTSGQTTAFASVLINFQQTGALTALDPSLGGQVNLGEKVLLDGTASTISGEDSLTYEWTLVEKPMESQTVIEDSEQSIATLIPDKVGRYTIRLEVNTGKISAMSEQALVAWEVTTATTEPETVDNAAASDGTTSVAPGCSLNY